MKNCRTKELTQNKNKIVIQDGMCYKFNIEKKRYK